MLRMPTKMCAKVSQLGNKKTIYKKIPPIKREKSTWKQKGTGELRESEKFARLLHDEQSRRPTIFAYDLFTQAICWPSWRLHILHFAPRKSKENLSQPWNCLWKFHRIFFFFDTWVVGERNLPSVCANNAVCTTKQGLKLVKFAWGNFVFYSCAGFKCCPSTEVWQRFGEENNWQKLMLEGKKFETLIYQQFR